MDWLHFLNLQFWYCVIYSLFGGECTYVNENGEVVPVVQAPPTEQVGFFESIVNAFSSGGSAVWDSVSGVLFFLWDAFSALSWTFSTLLFIAILATLGGLAWVRFRELSQYGVLPPKTEAERAMRDQWNELLEGALSSDPKEWRESILAADRMLGDLLGALGIQGATTPDKMRMLPEDAFQTVPQAWEAHRVRNFISSGASDFILTQREAFRVMKLYEQVFEEHRYI
ncbi:MAG: hypothetical protein AAB439_02105 [Patescibacteria group bacterium]